MHARRKEVNSELIYLFCFTVERIDSDIDGNCSALLKEPLCIFGFFETILPGTWQSIKGAKIAEF